MSDVINRDIAEILSHDIAWQEFDGSRVLVTGATGMVGRYVVETLLALQEKEDIEVDVVALARNPEKVERVFAGKTDKLTLITQDVSEPIEIEEGLDYIIHAASPASPDVFASDPVGVINANVLGSMHALELAKEHDAKYCFISTMEVYGQVEQAGEGDIVVAEDDYGRLNSLEQRSAYPESKRLAENLAVAYRQQHGVDARIARLTHTYGPGMDINDTRVQTDFMRKGLSGEDIVLKSDGSLRRTYTYISDAISGVFYILLDNGEDFVFNVADENSKLSIRELAETVLEVADSGSDLVFDIEEGNKLLWSKTKNTFVDTSRLRQLGWSAMVNPTEGVTRTMTFHKESQ